MSSQWKPVGRSQTNGRCHPWQHTIGCSGSRTALRPRIPSLPEKETHYEPDPTGCYLPDLRHDTGARLHGVLCLEVRSAAQPAGAAIRVHDEAAERIRPEALEGRHWFGGVVPHISGGARRAAPGSVPVGRERRRRCSTA